MRSKKLYSYGIYNITGQIIGQVKITIWEESKKVFSNVHCQKKSKGYNILPFNGIKLVFVPIPDLSKLYNNTKTMAKYLFILLGVAMWLPLSGYIVECQRLDEISAHIVEDTLVVFNINNVLTVSRQEAGSTPWAEEQIAQLIKEKGLSKPQATNLFIPLWHDILVASDVELFDPHAEAFVHALQRKGIKTMALTNRYTEMAYPTHKNLRSVGIDFAKTPPYGEDCWIDGVKSPSKYIEGIIFNGLINFKGDTLAAFLKQIDYTPKRLIYIEDKPKHLSQVEQSISALGIPFVGIHFGALELQREAYNPQLASVQVKFHYDILDDASALKICYADCQAPVEKGKQLVQRPPSHIQTIRSVKEVNASLLENALLITELDVLWSTRGSIGSRSFFQYHMDRQQFIGFSAVVALKSTERLVEKIHRRAKVSLLEEDSPLFLAEWARKNWSLGFAYRPGSLLVRTACQAAELRLGFNSPFTLGSGLDASGIMCCDVSKGMFADLEEKLSGLAILPSKLIGLSSHVEDLFALEEIARKMEMPFEGYWFEPQEPMLDEKILALELECLDRLLTNTEANILLETKK